jgi:tetratricopeptide (TPR) repeat protein
MSGVVPPHFTTALLLLFWCVLTPGTAAQDHMARVKELYASAAYEEALAELETFRLAPGADSLEPAEYRILCLLALGRSESAQSDIEQLILRHPMYRPDPSLVSPRVRATFQAVRRRLLPEIVETQYVSAMRSLDARHYSAALPQFDLVLSLLDDVGDDPRLAKLRRSASGFRDLASAAAPPADAAPPSDSAETPGSPGTGASNIVYDALAREVVPPVPVKQVLPAAPGNRALSTTTPGVIEIVIDESGDVEFAIVRRSIDPACHPEVWASILRYDTLLMQEARTWRYRPASRYGTAVKFRKLIEIYSAP